MSSKVTMSVMNTTL